MARSPLAAAMRHVKNPKTVGIAGTGIWAAVASLYVANPDIDLRVLIVLSILAAVCYAMAVIMFYIDRRFPGGKAGVALMLSVLAALSGCTSPGTLSDAQRAELGDIALRAAIAVVRVVLDSSTIRGFAERPGDEIKAVQEAIYVSAYDEATQAGYAPERARSLASSLREHAPALLDELRGGTAEGARRVLAEAVRSVR